MRFSTMRFRATLSAFVVLAACSLTRPDQDNFEIDASRGSIESFVSNASKNLNASASKSRLDIPDSDPGIMYELGGRGISVIVQSQADDRCNPNASRHTTHNQKRYYVDLVYYTSEPSQRAQAKEQLLRAAKMAGVAIQVFKECNYRPNT